MKDIEKFKAIEQVLIDSTIEDVDSWKYLYDELDVNGLQYWFIYKGLKFSISSHSHNNSVHYYGDGVVLTFSGKFKNALLDMRNRYFVNDVNTEVDVLYKILVEESLCYQ